MFDGGIEQEAAGRIERGPPVLGLVGWRRREDPWVGAVEMGSADLRRDDARDFVERRPDHLSSSHGNPAHLRRVNQAASQGQLLFHPA